LALKPTDRGRPGAVDPGFLDPAVRRSRYNRGMSDEHDKRDGKRRNPHPIGPLSRPAAATALLFGIAAGLAIVCLDMPAKLWAALIIGAIGGVVAPLIFKRWP
jgi:hypothetical protein